MARKRDRLEESGCFPMASVAVASTPADGLVARALRAERKRDPRKAVVLARQACALDEWSARTWTRVGALLGRLGHGDEALRALRHARWLRVRAGETGRVRSTEGLIRQLSVAA